MNASSLFYTPRLPRRTTNPYTPSNNSMNPTTYENARKTPFSSTQKKEKLHVTFADTNTTMWDENDLRSPRFSGDTMNSSYKRGYTSTMNQSSFGGLDETGYSDLEINSSNLNLTASVLNASENISRMSSTRRYSRFGSSSSRTPNKPLSSHHHQPQSISTPQSQFWRQRIDDVYTGRVR
eukprot:TRINITY_DN288_c0_g1_i2.p1 TRINITY_DN288_c0_g1~~TRINITY_DN288_c0_g1_i2.p1  ORF type:complete len:180 (-),score=41.89 TRINITY_DN288_c0_g1_i2:117-656(-)